MSERFFVPPIGDDEKVRLTGDEAHHLARVCRLRAGQAVVLFDGTGVECDAEVLEVGRREVVLSIATRRAVSRELPFALTLACCLPKPDRARWLIEKATELGVSRFVPLVTARASESARGVDGDKLRRWVIEASKQCGRNVLMDVTPPSDWRNFAGAVSADCVLLIASRSGESLRDRWDDVIARRANGVVLAVGPEGGFTDEEESLAIACGWTAVSLGPRVLRIETAALALLVCATI